MSNLSELLTVAHLSWATWAIHSRSLICLEQSERIPHSRSFDLSKMREWANSQPCFSPLNRTSSKGLFQMMLWILKSKIVFILFVAYNFAYNFLLTFPIHMYTIIVFYAHLYMLNNWTLCWLAECNWAIGAVNFIRSRIGLLQHMAF